MFHVKRRRRLRKQLAFRLERGGDHLCAQPFHLAHKPPQRLSVQLGRRIIQLGGTPVTEPKKWYDVTSCGYEAPDDPFVATILKQNIAGERCAIGFYKKLLEATQGKDPVTYNIVLQILQDEVEHEEDLQSLAEDLELMLKK